MAKSSTKFTPRPVLSVVEELGVSSVVGLYRKTDDGYEPVEVRVGDELIVDTDRRGDYPRAAYGLPLWLARVQGRLMEEVIFAIRTDGTLKQAKRLFYNTSRDPDHMLKDKQFLGMLFPGLQVTFELVTGEDDDELHYRLQAISVVDETKRFPKKVALG